jgi:hypothetical protein
MKDSDFKPVARARLRWLSYEEGGRRPVPPGPIFAATARFDEQPTTTPEISIVLRFRGPAPISSAEFNAEVGFLAPELVLDRLAPGVRFTVMEGPRPVAEGVIEELRPRVD